MKALKRKIRTYFFKKKVKEIEQGQDMFDMLESVLG